jgi:hypothetical protein
MKKTKNLFLCVIIALAAMSTVSLFAWETPVNISGSDGNFYNQPSIKFGPTGRAYMVYQSRVAETGRNDIFFRSYDGEHLSAVTVLTAGNPYIVTPFAPDIAVTSNEEVHVTWAEYNRSDSTQYIKYRYFNGTSWGPVELLVQTANFSDFGCEDLRIVADSSNNAFIAFYDPNRGTCSVVSKYFGKRATVDFPVAGRSKHVDVVCDDNYVHISWQHLMSPDYGILYQRKQNKENSRWLPTVNLNAYYTQRPRLDLDNDGNPIIAFWEDRGLDRRLWLRQWDPQLGLTNRDKTILLSSAMYFSYHYLDFSIRNNSMLATWQLGAVDQSKGFGGTIFYANKKSNSDTWNTDLRVPSIYPAYLVASDLTWDGSVAGIVGSTGTAIILYLSDRLLINNLPVAVISADKDSIFWDEEVAFNGSGSSDSDGSIVKYEWRIVQDKLTLEGPNVTYRFNKKFGAIRVRLTVTDNKGGASFTDKIITVNALFTPRATATKQLIKTLLYNREGYVISWIPNAKNDQAGYNIVSYKIFRKEAGSDYLEIGEVTSDKLLFADISAETGKTYLYAVSAVDEQGHKSPCGLNNNY